LRRTPYTRNGIRRVPCARCGAPSRYQWQACADRRHYRALCAACDIALNRLVLAFVRDPEIDAKMKAYQECVARAC
jgi:hypothetical protein